MNFRISGTKNLFLVCLVIALGHSSLAIITIDANQESRYINQTEYELFEDSSSRLTITDIGNKSFSFKSDNEGYNRNIESAYWMKIRVINKDTVDRKWVLEFEDTHITSLEFYSPYNDYKSEAVGFGHAFNTKKYQHKNFVFDLYTDPGKEDIYYVKFKSSIHSGFQFKLSENHVYNNYALSEYYYLGLFYGIILIMAAYNLILFISTRIRTHLYYTAYVLTCAVYAFGEDGLGFQFFWPSTPVLNHIFIMLGPLLLLVTFLFYSNSFLELKKRAPREQRLAIGSSVFYVLFVIITNLLQTQFDYWILIYLIPFLTTYYTALKLYRKGFKPARFFIIGFSVVILSFVILLFRILGHIPANILTAYSFNFGFVLEAILFSYALGDKIKLMDRDKREAQHRVIEELKINEELKDKVNRELEQKVSERTLELHAKSEDLKAANDELEELKEQLFLMNAELDKDNWKLKREVKEITESKLTKSLVPFTEFTKIYPDNLTCMKRLETLKWGDGFECRKCKHTNYKPGPKPTIRKCAKCKTAESITAHTLFHALKFPLNKAFYITYLTHATGEEFTVDELSESLELRRNTCWSFRKKVIERKESLEAKKQLQGSDSWEKIIFG